MSGIEKRARRRRDGETYFVWRVRWQDRAVSLWRGGLATLLVAVPAATRQLDSAEGTRLLAGVVSRFSTVAFASVMVLLTSGLVQAFFEVRHLNLLTSTGFGRAVLIKFGLLLVLIGLGAINRQRTVPRLREIARSGGSPGTAGMVLRRTMRAEVAIIAVVLGVTGALASYAPAIAVCSGPAAGTTNVAGKQLQWVVDPARVGSDQMDLYFIDPKSGAQWDGAQQVTVSESLASKQIGPLTQTGQKSGPGHHPAAARGACLGGRQRAGRDLPGVLLINAAIILIIGPPLALSRAILRSRRRSARRVG